MHRLACKFNLHGFSMDFNRLGRTYLWIWQQPCGGLQQYCCDERVCMCFQIKTQQVLGEFLKILPRAPGKRQHLSLTCFRL